MTGIILLILYQQMSDGSAQYLTPASPGSSGKDKDQFKPQNFTEQPLTVCQAGWSEFSEKCYKYFSVEKNWEDAKEECGRVEVRRSVRLTCKLNILLI